MSEQANTLPETSAAPGRETTARLPVWLRRPLSAGKTFFGTRNLLHDLRLATVCQEAKCPNIHECFSCGRATFMLLGEVCTRNCAFCNIGAGNPASPDPEEPSRVAEAAAKLALRHVVVTSVTRDDLPDGGAAHFAATVKAIRRALPKSTVEVLIPDLRGSEAALAAVIEARPEVINHNVETHPALYRHIRPQADYVRSLELLRRVRAAALPAKSGFMVGLGETDEQVRELLLDLKKTGCDIVTIGQYMRPGPTNPPVERYVRPETFEEYAAFGRNAGIRHVFSAPLVRSSYQAAESLDFVKSLPHK